MRHLIKAVAALVLLAAPVKTTAQAAPLLYVYRGAGCTGLAGLPQFEAMLGRKVDGVVDFNDYGKTPSGAVAQMNWQLGCWQGHVPRIAISIGLAFNGLSTAAIATGAADDMFRKMGGSLVAHGFPTADIRLGWESNGGWYGWGRKGGVYAAAFDRAARILKATPHSHFTIWFNPTAGMRMDQEQPTEEDGMALDEYANTWNSGGATTEPGLWKGNLNGWWGIHVLGEWPKPGMPTAVPELGAGSRGDHHGACPQTAATACDDPYWLTSALQQADKVRARFVGIWDYNAGDYNSQVSTGERPNEAIVLMRRYGSPNLRAILQAHETPFSPTTPPTLECKARSGGQGCHFAVVQTGPADWKVVVWAGQAQRAVTVDWTGQTGSAELYVPARGTSPVQSLGAVNSAKLSFKGADQYVIAIRH